MDCIQGLLSLSPYCGLPAPSTGVYLNTLPGISTEFAQKIASGDQQTFLDVWNACLVEAVADLKQDVLLFLSKRVNFVESQYTTTQPYVKATAEVLEPVEAELRGVQVILPEGRHVRLHLKGVWLHAMEETNISIVISDSSSSEVLETIVHPLVAGLQYVPVNKEYGDKSKEIRIEINSGVILSKPLHFNNAYHYYFDSCQKDCCLQADTLSIYPIVAGQRVTNPAGIWIDAEVICSIESFICQHIHKLIQCLKHKMGEKLLNYKLMSYRVNVFSSSPTEFTETKIAKFNERYRELLQLALDQIDYTNEGVCFDCEDNFTITTAYVMP